MDLSIALYRPMIPPNTGNIARLSVALGCELYIVGKTPIKWNEPALKRAGLDQWDKVKFTHFKRFKDFYKNIDNRRVICVTKSSKNVYWDFEFKEDDILLFGNEPHGLPPKMLKVFPESVQIPMWTEGVRSINLSNSVSIVAYEYARQMTKSQRVNESFIIEKRTYYKK